MINILKQRKIFAHGEHENIEVWGHFIFSLDDGWKDVICRKCRLTERAQKDKKYLDDNFIVGGKENA